MEKLMRSRKRRASANCSCGRGCRCPVVKSAQSIPATRAMDTSELIRQVNQELEDYTKPIPTVLSEEDYDPTN